MTTDTDNVIPLRPDGAPQVDRRVPTPPGVYTTLDEAQYHSDPASLSQSQAKVIIGETPAHLKWQLDNPRPYKRAFEFGHAAHAEVLGVGADVVVVQATAKDGTKSDATDYRLKSTQEHRDEIRAAGKTPLLADEVMVVRAMAKQLRAHPIAMALLDPDHGQPEVSAFWTDEEYGVTRRMRLDWLPHTRGGRLIIPDYKTSVTANPTKLPKQFADYRYHMQDDWYREGAVRTGMVGSHDDVAFVFIVQEKTPPFPVTVHEIDLDGKTIGRQQNTLAVATYADCVRTGEWPAYPVGVNQLALPPWYVSTHLEQPW